MPAADRFPAANLVQVADFRESHFRQHHFEHCIIQNLTAEDAQHCMPRIQFSFRQVGRAFQGAQMGDRYCEVFVTDRALRAIRG